MESTNIYTESDIIMFCSKAVDDHTFRRCGMIFTNQTVFIANRNLDKRNLPWNNTSNAGRIQIFLINSWFYCINLQNLTIRPNNVTSIIIRVGFIVLKKYYIRIINLKLRIMRYHNALFSVHNIHNTI